MHTPFEFDKAIDVLNKALEIEPSDEKIKDWLKYTL